MSIRGKIAQIIDDTKVVINVGSRDGVILNQKFVIYEEGDEILDPDTGVSLGKIEVPKGHIIIEHVQDKIAIGVTEQKAEDASERKTLSELMVEASTPVKNNREKLMVDPYSMKPLPSITPVKVGDRVRAI